MLNRRQGGFSLIELVVGLAILGMLIALGVPQYSTFIANARLRAAADGINNGLNLARAEAVKRNARVELLFTDEEPIEGLVNTVAPVVNGPNWMVRAWVATANAYDFVEGKLGAEGSGKSDSGGVVVATTTPGIYDGTVTFTGFGALASGQPLSFQVSYPAGGACDTVATPGPMRCLNVNVTPGGQIRICDPKITAAKDTRAC